MVKDKKEEIILIIALALIMTGVGVLAHVLPDLMSIVAVAGFIGTSLVYALAGGAYSKEASEVASLAYLVTFVAGLYSSTPVGNAIAVVCVIGTVGASWFSTHPRGGE